MELGDLSYLLKKLRYVTSENRCSLSYFKKYQRTLTPTDLYQEGDGYKNGEYKHSAQSVQVQGSSAHPVHQRY